MSSIDKAEPCEECGKLATPSSFFCFHCGKPRIKNRCLICCKQDTYGNFKFSRKLYSSLEPESKTIHEDCVNKLRSESIICQKCGCSLGTLDKAISLWNSVEAKYDDCDNDNKSKLSNLVSSFGSDNYRCKQCGEYWILSQCKACGYPISRDQNLHLFCQKNRSIESPQKSSKACFIATVCYGSHDSHEVVKLRKFRDHVLLRSKIGRIFVSVYYKFSPAISDYISKKESRKRFIRNFILDKIIQIIDKILSKRA